jgi:hypothetical protein
VGLQDHQENRKAFRDKNQTRRPIPPPQLHGSQRLRQKQKNNQRRTSKKSVRDHVKGNTTRRRLLRFLKRATAKAGHQRGLGDEKSF